LTGNQLLQAVAKALQGCCRNFEYAARMGGDEFVIVCSGVERDAVNERIPIFRAAIRDAGESICGPGLLDSSFGSALFPEDGENVDELLAAADRHMYQDKAQTKSGSHYQRRIEKASRLHRRRAGDELNGDERNQSSVANQDWEQAPAFNDETDWGRYATCDRAT
jgi:GGDEF domain-containing protein